jgi:hypothetical protein
VGFPRTHDLGTLIDLLGKAGICLPADLAGVDRLTPFGTTFRYDEPLPRSVEARRQWLAWVRSLRAILMAMER